MRDMRHPSPSAFLVFGLSAVGRAGFDAVTDAADDAVGRCFVTFDIEILRSVQWRRRAAPPKPHIGQQAGGAGSQSALASELAQYRSNRGRMPVLCG